MCMPPSKSTQISATVTIRSTARCPGESSDGTTATATAATTNTKAGSSTLIRSVRRLETTSTNPTTAVNNTTTPNGSVSVTRTSVVGRNHPPTRLLGSPPRTVQAGLAQLAESYR
jgi:hypothetical protein